jgi:hypothetical protein
MTQNSVSDGCYLYRSQENKVLVRRSGLCPEKELLELRSGTFRHKNTLVCMYAYITKACCAVSYIV